MRIGIDGHMIGDHSGGNESYYTNILKVMEPRDDDTVILFLRPGVNADLFKDKYQIVYYESTNSFARNYIEIPKLIRKYKLDVLHMQYFIPVVNQLSCPVVTTIHDICFEHYKNIFTKKEYIRQKLLIPYAAKHSKYIFTVSNNAKEDISSTYRIDPNKIIVTYNAVNSDFRKLNETELDEKSLRTKFNIGTNKYILTVGNLQPRKNLPRLIRSFINFNKNASDEYKLVIVGKKGWMFNDIIQEATKDSTDIVFTDYISNFDLIRLYNAANAFVYPSFFEGFGIPPLEAMACGTQVAVSNATALPEVVGNAGIYFDPFDEKDIENALKKVTTIKIDDGLMKEQVNKFSWKKSAKIIYDTYHRI